MTSFPFTAEEFHLWPLVHGSSGLETKINSIREKGLLPAREIRRGTNSFDYDSVLGRTDFIFAEPITIRSGYGMGNCVLIDPIVFSVGKVKCSFHDVGDVLKQVERLIMEAAYSFPDWIFDPETLQTLTESACSKAIQEMEDRGTPADLRSFVLPRLAEEHLTKDREFQIYAESYFTGPYEFFKKLVDRSSDQHNTMVDFIRRKRIGSPEEVLMRDQVPHEFLLGFRINGRWIPECNPSSKDVAERLAHLVSLWDQER